MALIRKLHVKNDFAGTWYFGSDSVPVDAAVVPSAVTTASGDTPATSINFNWTGHTDSPAGPGAFSTGAERCEMEFGGSTSYVEAGEYWLDFRIKFITASTISDQRDDWNYIFQQRSDGSTPSPAPSIAMFGDNLIFRRNISGYGEAYDTMGAIDRGGDWHHYQVGWKWSISATQGWVEIWRDGTNVVTRKTCRTAFDTANDATLRCGYYRSPAINGANQYYLWGQELHSTRVEDVGAPADETGPTLTVTEPVADAVVAGALQYTVTVSDDSGVASVAYSLIGPAPATDEIPVYTETSAPWDDSDDFDPFDTSALADGDYTLRVVATDTAANSTTVDVEISIGNHPVVYLPPVVSIRASNMTPFVDEQFTVSNVFDSEPNGFIETLAWDFDNDGQFDDSTAFGALPLSFSTPGPHIIRMFATDIVGQTATGSITINVQEIISDPGPDPPVPDPVVIVEIPITRGMKADAVADPSEHQLP